MRTHPIHVANGREAVDEIRRQLFLFPEVLEVFITGRPDFLVVVCAGHPRPGEWLSALRALGYDTPARRNVRLGVAGDLTAPRTDRSEAEPPMPRDQDSPWALYYVT